MGRTGFILKHTRLVGLGGCCSGCPHGGRGSVGVGVGWPGGRGHRGGTTERVQTDTGASGDRAARRYTWPRALIEFVRPLLTCSRYPITLCWAVLFNGYFYGDHCHCKT